MTNRLHAVAELPQFIRDAEAAGVTEEKRSAIIMAIAQDPLQGDEVRGSGGVRKVRVAGRGKGKSGGYRVMTAYFGNAVPVYLLALLNKGERVNFSDRELAGFKAITTAIAKSWKEKRR